MQLLHRLTRQVFTRAVQRFTLYSFLRPKHYIRATIFQESDACSPDHLGRWDHAGRLHTASKALQARYILNRRSLTLLRFLTGQRR